MVLLLVVPDPSQAQQNQKVDFNRDIRPILSNRCSGCHGGVKRKSGLSFLSKHDVMRELDSGERAVVPGKPDQSELYRRIISKDLDDRMPPKGGDPTIQEEDLQNVVKFLRTL